MVTMPDSAEFIPLLEQLEALGYFRFVKPERVQRIKARFLKKPNFWRWLHDVKRDYPADAEALAEGDVKEFFKDIRAVLKASGVPFPKIKEIGKDGYFISINDTWYELYSEADLKLWHSWDVTTRRSFALINKLFRDSGSNERIYSVRGGNDHWAYILTEAQFTAFANSALPGKEGIHTFTLYDVHELPRRTDTTRG
jgi:hypothetical protein